MNSEFLAVASTIKRMIVNQSAKEGKQFCVSNDD